ncbi:MAG: helix-turn-helix domain-containing protein [Pseudomonadaceae bacterium]
MKPDASNHNPDPAYLRGLRAKAGKSQQEIAELLGIGRRIVQYYEAPEDSPGRSDIAPYLYQYALEQLAATDSPE